jgi:hypothetical protein
MTEMAQRRELRFHNLDEVVRDAEHLQEVGYSKVGKWDLTQLCKHLVEWMRYPVDGYPKLGCLIGPMLWLMKVTIGKRILRTILATSSMRAGAGTLKQTVFEPGGDSAEAVDRLKQTVQRFKAHGGDYYPSPLFGFLTRDEALKLQLVHCAHHLSFLIPTAG